MIGGILSKAFSNSFGCFPAVVFTIPVSAIVDSEVTLVSK